jgi:hypothetical protein
MMRRQDLLDRASAKVRFHDSHDRRAYARAAEIAARIVDDPSLLERGRAYLERFMRDDPRQRRVYDVWLEVLALGPERVALALVADDDEGAYLRSTAPVFTTIEADVARRLAGARS